MEVYTANYIEPEWEGFDDETYPHPWFSMEQVYRCCVECKITIERLSKIFRDSFVYMREVYLEKPTMSEEWVKTSLVHEYIAKNTESIVKFMLSKGWLKEL